MARLPLFREAALAEQQDRWLGTVLVVPRAPAVAATVLVAAVVGAILALGAFGEFTRKARLGGFLAPREGLISVVPPMPGVLTRVAAEEGSVVAAGDPLAVLSADRASPAVGATGDLVVRGLVARRDSQRAERTRQAELSELHMRTLDDRIAAMAAEIEGLDREAALGEERVALAEGELARQRALRGRGITTEPEVVEAEAEALSQRAALAALVRSRTALVRQRVEVEAERAEAPLRRDTLLAGIDRAVAELDGAVAEAEAAREVVIVAPQAGTVTALGAGVGSSVGPDTALLTMVPAGATLEARLYAPSRAVGFLRAGQPVLIRFAAFPFQKFGQYPGTVRSVSLATVGAAELGERAAVLADVAPGEPMYRVTVDLAAQVARAYGEAVRLQPGMQLEADVAIDTRRLWEWVLDPLWSLTGRRA